MRPIFLALWLTACGGSVADECHPITDPIVWFTGSCSLRLYQCGGGREIRDENTGASWPTEDGETTPEIADFCRKGTK